MNERQLIAHLKETLQKPQILENWLDDDCEIINRGDHFQLITVDTSSEKADFPSNAPPFEIGYFSTALSLSDIAACGGVPEGIMVSVSVSPDFDPKIIAVYDGIKKAAKDAVAPILGGDSNSAGEFSLSVVSLGRVEKNSILKRGTARIGDKIGVTGTLDKFNTGYHQYHQHTLIDYQLMLRQSAKIEIGQILSRFSHFAGVTSCIDLPDGLAKALTDNTRGKYGYRIKDDQIPLENPHTNPYKTRFEAASRPAGDLELLFTADKDQVEKINLEFRRSGLAVHWIGQVTKQLGITLEKDGALHSPQVEGFVHKFEGYKLFS